MLKTKELRGNIYRGDRHYNWQGGLSFEPYTKEFNNPFRLFIRQREGFMCIRCNMKEEDCLKLFKHRLNIHHVNYDKQLTIKENCCALCVRCNCEANFNRKSWTKFYQSLLSERYGYKYEDNGLIVLGVQNLS
jgi:hypothetical protein